MSDRRLANKDRDVAPLLNLLERRFAVELRAGPLHHLREVQQHYREKRGLLLAQYGETAALQRPEYAKAFLISEAARLMILREIKPRPKKKKPS